MRGDLRQGDGTGLAGGTTYYYVASTVVSGSETPNSTQATATTPSSTIGSLAGTAGILYLNGVSVGMNSGMTITPSSLGGTVIEFIQSRAQAG